LTIGLLFNLAACGSPEHNDQHKPISQASVAECVNDPSLSFECAVVPVKPGF